MMFWRLVGVASTSLTMSGCGVADLATGHKELHSSRSALPYERVADCIYSETVKATGGKIAKIDLSTQKRSRIERHGDDLVFWAIEVSSSPEGGSSITVIGYPSNSPGNGGISERHIYAPIAACS